MANVRKYRVELTGVAPLLMHNDDIAWADAMDAWKDDKNNKATSKAGDDRSPAWRWIGNLYRDETNIIMPTENIMKSLMGAGAMVAVPGAKHGKTFKAQTQSGIMPTTVGWPLLVKGKPVSYEPFRKLIGNKDFEAHKKFAESMGFYLFPKRAKIGNTKHIRIRPRFDHWSAIGDIIVTDEQITTPVLGSIFETAGLYKGLCDWRPGGRTPGSFGMFTAVVKEV